MKTMNRIFSLALIALTLSACGGSTQSAQPVTSGNIGTTTNGTSGYYNSNGQWVQTGAVGQGGCVPLQSQLSFTANGANMSNSAIFAGSFPSTTGIGTYGQVIMGGAPLAGAQGTIQFQPKQSTTGTLQISAGSANGVGSVSGSILLSQAAITYIQQYYGGTMNNPNGTYPNNTTQSLCVNSLAIWAVETSYSSGNSAGNNFGGNNFGGNNFGGNNFGGNINGNQNYGPQTGIINQALVYLYLNNGQQAGPLQFY